MFSEQTRDRGIDYYRNGHVLEIRCEDACVTGAVAGTQPRPYTVVIDTRCFERAVCSCTVGYACKHIVAVVLYLQNDEQTDPEIRERVAQIASVAGLPRDPRRREAVGGDFTIELEAGIRKAERIRAAETRRLGTNAQTGAERYAESEDEGAWRLALLVSVETGGRPEVALVRQYRRRDGEYGRVEACRGPEPVYVPDASARKLADRLRVLGGVAPVVAFAKEIAATKLPIFAGNRPFLSGVQNSPVRVLRPRRFDLAVIPVISERRWLARQRTGREPSSAVGLTVGMNVTAGHSGYAVSPGSRCTLDEGLGFVVADFAPDNGLLLIADEESPLSAVCRSGFSSAPTSTPAAVAELQSIAIRYPDSVSIRVPARVRVTERPTTPIFTLTPFATECSVRLELEEGEETDGYSSDEYIVHVGRRAPPDKAIAAASKLIGSRPSEQRRRDAHYYDPCVLWRWEEPITNGDPDLLTLARKLTELGYTVYIATPNGKRLVRRARALSVSVSSGTHWFAPTVVEGETPALDMRQLHELTTRGSIDDGESLVLFDPAATERIRRLLALADVATDGRLPIADIASFAELIELVDEVPSDLEPLRELAAAIVSGTKPCPPRTPADLTAILRPYQLDGFAWLASLAHFGLSGCLADDMGLGKTVQALTLMLHLLEINSSGAASPAAIKIPDDSELIPGTFLVIAPVSTLGNWSTEATRFAPRLTTRIHHGGYRATEPEALAATDLVLTSYATAVRDAECLRAIEWRLIVLDEAQAIKNPRSATAKRVKQLPSDLRLCLTGTPVENVSTDLWSIMDFLVPGLLGTLPEFGRRFPKRNVHGSEQGAQRLARLSRIVTPFLLRRTKEAVAPELPPKIETVLSCEMGSKQASFYETLRVHHHNLVEQAIGRGKISEVGTAIVTGLVRLRQAAIFPPSADPTGRNVLSTKEQELVVQLDEISQKGHRALVFSQFVSALSAFRDRTAERGITTLYLDGRTRNRDELIDRFQRAQDPCVFFISLKAGGTGINLTAADHVFICDPWWNPQVERQAVDRAHRIGRERPVIVTRLVTDGTIEQKMLDLQEQKRALAADLISENAGAIDLAVGAELLALFER